MTQLEWLELLLVAAIGLHLPKAFTLLYGLIALIIWRSFRDRRAAGSPWQCWLAWWPSLLTITLFSAVYVAGMIAWGFWSWQADRADLINALLLPVLLLGAGLQSVRFGWMWLMRILIAYALGALVYTLVCLGVSRVPWWDAGQVFPSALHVPWGAASQINVRSVEQNALPALALLPVSLVGLVSWGAAMPRWLVPAGVVMSGLAAHAVWSLQGRLGWLVLALAMLPLVAAAVVKLFSLLAAAWQKWVAVFVAAIAIAWLLIGSGRHRLGSVGWSQGLCDERISLHLAILRHGFASPWGGRSLLAPYQLCDGAAALLAPQGGSVSLAHNVFLDVFLDAGYLPAALLLIALLPLLVGILTGFSRRWHLRLWSWRSCLGWSWFVLLFCEWSFQPLLYADGLLYYFSFFVLAALAAGLRGGEAGPASPISSKGASNLVGSPPSL